MISLRTLAHSVAVFGSCAAPLPACSDGSQGTVLDSSSVADAGVGSGGTETSGGYRGAGGRAGGDGGEGGPDGAAGGGRGWGGRRGRGGPVGTGGRGNGTGGLTGAGNASADGGTSICGNTLVEGREHCDDGNTVDLDGCTNCIADCDECIRESCGPTSPDGLDFIQICFQMEGTAAAGAASGEEKAALCTAAMSCSLRTNCWVQGQADCYCGAGVDLNACEAGSVPPEGPCIESYELAAESDSGQAILARLGDPSFALGGAGLLQLCATERCLSTCAAPYRVCGDGTEEGPELCDDGNTEAGDGCSPACLLEVCGNGVKDPQEFCDDGNTLPYSGGADDCPSHCGSCGNDQLDPGEECDDGNEANLDTCTPACQVDRCGNSVLDTRDGGETEECDDGNRIGTDGCNEYCEIQVCGNLELEGSEGCDDGNLTDDDGCSARCVVEQPVCGDGDLDLPEECDDGNRDNNDGCSENCTRE